MSKPYVGIIYSKRRWNRITSPKGNFKKQLSYIEEAGKKNDVIPCFVRLFEIKPGIKTIKAYVKGKKGYKIETLPCPDVFYNRIVDGRKERKHIQKLLAEGKKIFNERNSDYGKYPIWKLLSENNDLLNQLPYTRKATRKNVVKMMQTYNDLILKPNLGAVGKGVMSLEKQEEYWCLSCKDKKGMWKKSYFQKEFPQELTKIIKKKTYIVQERIILETYLGNPFDTRVVVQRNGHGIWELTAFIVKVAEKGKLVTNVTQGGKVYTLEKVLKNHPTLTPNKVMNNVSEFTLNIAEFLSTKLPHIGDLGMDIGITSDGTPHFIEVNYLSDYETLSFRDDKLISKKWKKIYTKPIDYGSYLNNGATP